jgi:hypothetical protein
MKHAQQEPYSQHGHTVVRAVVYNEALTTELFVNKIPQHMF